ncbi:MAG: branched-chain amino acid transport system permease protein [Gaiellales bacterium]|jgi:branched-chain amino acid transport system permease protein|nr:branched-chain amino acid transport system permease protein [Gaiellales bacterium]
MRSAARLVLAVWPPLSLIVAVLAVMLLTHGVNPQVNAYLIQALISGILVLGLYIFVGNSGVVSLGHASFMAVGAYVGGILSIPLFQRATLLPDLPGWIAGHELSLWWAALVAVGVSVVLGYLIAIPLSRLSGLAAAVSTLALLQITQVVELNWTWLTSAGGATPGIPADVTRWDAFAGVVVAILVAFLYQRSSSGVRLRASREDSIAAQAIGVNIARERRLALALSAGILGLGGAMYAHFVGVVTPTDYFIQASFLMLAMLVIGGVTSMAGAVVGVAVVSLITDLLLQIESTQGLLSVTVSLPNGIDTLIIAVILVLILIVRPSGLTGGREVGVPRRLRNRITGASPGAGVPPPQEPPPPPAVVPLSNQLDS